MSAEYETKPNGIVGAPEPTGIEVPKRAHHDQYVHYNHEMNEDTAESAARLLIRAVPVAYGLLLGGLINDLLLGFFLGALLSIALDLQMAEKSMFAPWLKPLMAKACPHFALLARSVGRLFRARRLAHTDCGVPHE
ncbi:MAG: hypothetical protein KDJ27_11675 [Gammaproteobacteria bacterium]|nr:hypothetical protein [Gammaproteobacteria bacterium]MCB1924381.1 hypothetical protein [Gammaproteobacteria bacterium]